MRDTKIMKNRRRLFEEKPGFAGAGRVPIADARVGAGGTMGRKYAKEEEGVVFLCIRGPHNGFGCGRSRGRRRHYGKEVCKRREWCCLLMHTWFP